MDLYPECLGDMWEINVWDQTQTFLFSLLLGAIFCLFYDVFRAMRKTGINSFVSVFITDMLFWIISAFATYLFLLSRTNGQLRGYVLLSLTGGFVICRISISNIFVKALTFLFTLAFKGFDKINKGANKILGAINAFFDKIYIFFAKKLILWLKSAKKVLKNKVRLLYTKQAGNKSRKKTDSEHILNEF